jgi:hypothetical protein
VRGKLMEKLREESNIDFLNSTFEVELQKRDGVTPIVKDGTFIEL